MIVFYDPKSLTPTHVVHMCGQDYHDWIKSPACTESYIEYPTDLAPSLIYLSKDAAGNVICSEKQNMGIICAALSVSLGADIQFSKVPDGATITMNDAPLGVMDATGDLDVTANTAGAHNFIFSLAGYMDGVFNIEVISQP